MTFVSCVFTICLFRSHLQKMLLVKKNVNVNFNDVFKNYAKNVLVFCHNNN